MPETPRPKLGGMKLAPRSLATVTLVEREGPLTARAVADRLNIALTTASVRLARLEAAGLVRRQFAPDHWRSAYVWEAV